MKESSKVMGGIRVFSGLKPRKVRWEMSCKEWKTKTDEVVYFTKSSIQLTNTLFKIIHSRFQLYEFTIQEFTISKYFIHEFAISSLWINEFSFMNSTSWISWLWIYESEILQLKMRIHKIINACLRLRIFGIKICVFQNKKSKQRFIFTIGIINSKWSNHANTM
jgi:hypothetical protein